jgi:threonylcarbamoyladenosine tRNA methylthiotransferase MtaB
MRRPYTAALYAQLVKQLARSRPGLGLGADVIAGHPGETEADFADTMALVEELPFSYLHVFPYSDRPGTEAALMDGHADERVIRRRSRRLRDLGRRKNRAFREGLVGTAQELLVLETRDATDHLVGLTGNYVEVAFAGDDALKRSRQMVRIMAVHGDATLGEMLR